MLLQDDVSLKGSLGRVVAALLNADCIPHDPVADPQPGHGWADGDDVAGHVGPQHGRIAQPGQHDAAGHAAHRVDRVHRDRASPNDHLARPRGGDRRVPDPQRAS